MIKTFKEGNKTKVMQWKAFSCSNCDWIGAADKDDYKSSSHYNESYYYLRCPCCDSAFAHEIEDETLKEEILREIWYE